jgi:CSLREA domain-containing protein
MLTTGGHPLTFIPAPYGRAASALCASALLLSFARGAQAATFTVNSTADAVDATPGNGLCETSNPGECTLRAAIMEANALAQQDVVVLPAGHYVLTLSTPDEDANAGGDLDVTDDLVLTGASAATTLVDGALHDRVFHVLSGIVAISDVTIQNGKTTDGSNGALNSNGGNAAAGGGIYNSGSLTLTRVVVTGNQTGKGGNAGNVSCSFCDAVGGNGGHGGGISGPGTLTVVHSRVQSNMTGAGGLGPSVIDCGGDCFTGPGDRGNGGGIEGGVVTVGDSRLEANAAYDGGAIQQGGTLVVNGSSLVENHADWSGGAINCNSGEATCTISSSTLSGNGVTGGYGGGAIAFFNSGVKTVASSTISGNTATNGGGIRAFSGPVGLSFVTITKNTATTGDGGGVAQTFSALTLVGTLVADNTVDGGQAPDCTGTLTSLGHNLVRATAGCGFAAAAGDLTASDPKLGPLVDNGGPTFTHALQGGSAALDAGGDATCGLSVTVDERGVKRPIGATCDIGAFEVEPIGDANGDGSVNVTDVFYLINRLFAQGPVPRGRANVNGDGATNVLDVFYLINFLFASGPAPV